jgi:hypothetical protein
MLQSARDSLRTEQMRTLLLLTVFVSLLSGCTSYRQVTPWLRTSEHTQFELLAESGGGARGNWSKTERRVNGEWVTIPNLGTQTMPFAEGTRALIDDHLYGAAGEISWTGCKGSIRGLPDGSAFLCISTEGEDPKSSQRSMRIQRFDKDGKDVRRREVELPVQIETASSLRNSVDYHLLGFELRGMIFTVFVDSDAVSFGQGAHNHCDAYLLRPDDQWIKVGRMEFESGDLWRCNFPEPWREEKGFEIDYGRVQHGHQAPIGM